MRKCYVGTYMNFHVKTFWTTLAEYILHEFEAKSDQKWKWVQLLISANWIGIEKSTYSLDSVQVIWVIEYDGLKVFIVVFPYLSPFYLIIVRQFIIPNWHEERHFPPPCPIWTRFCQLYINRVNLTPCQAHFFS